MTKIPGPFPHDDDLNHDTLSEPGSNERRSVHPYRGQSERTAMLERRRTLARELDEAERAAERRGPLARRLTVVDGELRRRALPLLERIAIETPCRERWERMGGDERVRRCARCHRDVYDLALMTHAEIETLFVKAGGVPCVRLRRRPDGRVVTADCPVPPPSIARRVVQTAVAGAMLGASAAAGAAIHSAYTDSSLGHAYVAPPPMELLPAPIPEPMVPFSMARAEIPPAPEEPMMATTMGAPVLAPPPITDDELDRHIRWIAPQAWEVDRELVERLLSVHASAGAVMRRTLVIPHERGGRVIGVKVYGIRRSSFWARVGLQNGDTIMDVNGVPMSSPDRVLEGYTRLPEVDALFIRLERRGEERVHVLRITP
jgi:hypothetical protein